MSKQKSFLDAELLHSINYEYYKNSEAEAVLAILEKSNREIAKMIKQTSAVATKKRYAEIAKALKELTKAAREAIAGHLDIDGILQTELSVQMKILSNVLPDVSFLLPSVAQVKSSALFRPVTLDGVTFEESLNRIQDNLYATWDSAVRTGYLSGLTTQQIVRNVMGEAAKGATPEVPGSMSAVRSSLERDTITALAMFADEARASVFKKNEDIFLGYRYVATLDTRTCVVCAADDGKVFASMEDKKAPKLPQHRRCRCLYLAVIPGFDELDGERAAMDGPVPEKTTYADWIAELDKEHPDIARDILGKSRYELWKQGTPITDFVSGGRKLTLKELRAREGLNE